MADNVVVTAGTGTTIAADELTDGVLGSVKVQYVKLMDGTLDSSTKAAVGTNGLAADVKASVLPTGAATSAKQPALGTAGTPSADVITVQGATSMTALKTDSSATTQPVSGTVTANAGTGNFTVTQATAGNLNATVVGTGTFAVQAAATLSAETTKVIGTVRNGDGAGNLFTSNSSTYTAKFAQDANLLGTLGTAFSTAGKVDVKAADGDVFVRQATASNLNATVVGTGTFAVQATQSGTWTVQPGNTANSTPWLANPVASATGGYTPAKLISAATTNATSVKASAGTVGYITASNTNAAARYLKLYNKASAPTVGTDTPVHTFLIPGNTAGAGTNIPLPPQGINFTTGIAFATTTGAPDSDTGAVALNEVIVNYGTI